jgi:hypothetical protein
MKELIQSAKDKAARELGWLHYNEFEDDERPSPATAQLIDQVARLAIEAERERLLEALPLEITPSELADEVEQLELDFDSAFAYGWENGMLTQFDRLRAEFVELLTPTDKP